MPISSLIIQTTPEETESLARRIHQFSNTSVVNTFASTSTIIAITETSSRSSDQEAWKRIEETEGVVDVRLIYHNFEDVEQ